MEKNETTRCASARVSGPSTDPKKTVKIAPVGRGTCGRNIRYIIVHCTATPAGREVTVADIDSWHRARGFAGIGYHYVVGLDGSVTRGRDERIAGAHCKGHNSDSIGVVYVGGMTADMKRAADTRTDAQREGLRRIIAELRERYPGAEVRSHYEFAAKACPCFDAHKEYGGEVTGG